MVSRELLSAHKTVARFDGLTERKCFHRTALCPDQCDHGGTIGTFSIQKYLHYEKPGKYGDEKAEKYHVKVNESSEKSGLTGEIKSVFDNLNPGDYVLLSWNHDYVNRNECHSPERPITDLRKITEEEAAKM